MPRNWPVSVCDAEVRREVAEWSELLAAGRFADALTYFGLWQDEYAEAWTPELLASRIANYGCPDPDPDGRAFAVTALADLPGGQVDEYLAKNVEIDRVNLYGLDPARYLGMVHYAGVPLNGSPSDLTAQFAIRKLPNGRMTLEFMDVHVM